MASIGVLTRRCNYFDLQTVARSLFSFSRRLRRLMLELLASHPGRFFALTGDNSLRSRPMSRVVKPLQKMGATT